jgi:hypothetical protein
MCNVTDNAANRVALYDRVAYECGTYTHCSDTDAN